MRRALAGSTSNRDRLGAPVAPWGRLEHFSTGVVALPVVPDSPLNEAMERYADGDAAAFNGLYDGLAPRLYGYLVRQTRDRARAEDLVQQTFLQIHGARGHFKRGADVLPWAMSIARRLLIDSLRRGKFEAAPPDPSVAGAELGLELTGDMARYAEFTEELPDARQAARVVAQKLSALPENQRTAFELIRGEGLSHAQAAQSLGTTVTAIKLRLHRATEALRAALRLAAAPPQAVPAAKSSVAEKE